MAFKQAWSRALAPLLQPDSAPQAAVALADKIAAVTPLDGNARRLALSAFAPAAGAGDGQLRAPARQDDRRLCVAAFVPSLKAVIKLDDDHRLGDPRALLELLGWAAGHKAACQIGNLYLRLPGSPQSRLATWSTGEFDYILNRPALLRMLCARLYYRRWIGTVLYEDIAMGEPADKLGIRKNPRPLDGTLRAHCDY